MLERIARWLEFRTIRIGRNRMDSWVWLYGYEPLIHYKGVIGLGIRIVAISATHEWYIVKPLQSNMYTMYYKLSKPLNR